MSFLSRDIINQKIIVVSSAQISTPTAGMISDYSAIYQLNAAPYTRYQSDGTELVAVTQDSSTINQLITSGFGGILDAKADITAYGRSNHTGTQDSSTVLYQNRSLTTVITELYGLIASAGGTPATPGAPVVSAAPTIAFPGGTADVGETATITQGTYSSGTVTSRTWNVIVNGVIVSNTSTTTFTVPTSASVSPRGISVVELAAWAGGSPVNNPSQTYTVNAPSSIAQIITFPSITGGNLIGTILTGSVGTWTNGPTSYKKQWKKNGNNQGGLITSAAITETLDTTGFADGDVITFAVIATNAAGDTGTYLSSGVSMIADSSGVPNPATIRSGKSSTTSVVTATSNSTITGLWINHSGGHGIVIPPGVHDVTIINNEIGPIGNANGDPSNYHGIRIGAGCYNITITENVIHDVTSAMTAYQSFNPIVFTKNFCYNIRGPFYAGQMVQFESVKGGSGQSQVKCNIYDGDYGTIRGTEDVISMYDHEGANATNLRTEISYNRIRGVSTPPEHQNGSGIMVGDGPNGGKNIYAHHNVITQVVNVGMGIAGGSNITFDSNEIYNNHSRSALGMYVRDNPGNSGGTPSPANTHTVSNNRIYCKDFMYQNGVLMNYEDNSGLAVEVGNVFGDTSLDTTIFNVAPSECGGTPGGSSPTFVASATASYDAAVNKPTGTANGDLVLLFGVCHGASQTITAPAGFTQIGSTTSSTSMSMAVFRKTASSEPATYTVTFSDANNITIAATYRGQNATPIDASSAAAYNIASASPVTTSSPTATTATANARVLWIAGVDASVDGPTYGFTVPGGYTSRVTTDNGSFCGLAFADQVKVSAGATGVISGSTTISSGTANTVGFTVAIKPA
jgi:hypothetical protein